MVVKRTGSLVLGAALLTTLAIAPEAHAIRVRHDVPIGAYNELASQAHLTAVGFVHAANMGCSGSLVGPDTVLTAAHCLTRDDGSVVPPSQVTFRIDFPDGSSTTYRAKYVDIHPDWDRQRNKNTDVAVITLDREVQGVTPLLVTTANPHERIGTLVGYGTQGTGNHPTSNTYLPGAKRRLAAQNVIDRVRQECCNRGNYVIHVDFDQPSKGRSSSLGDRKPLPLEGGASFGDSGSPLLARFGDRDFIVGVASYIYGQGTPGPAGYGEVAGYQWMGSGEVEFWLEMVGVTVNNNPFAAQIDITDGPNAQPGMDDHPADMDNDDVIDAQDAAMVLGYLSSGDLKGDINNDGRLDMRDAAHVLEALGFRQSRYPKKQQWKRAVRDYFRNEVEPHLVGYSKKDRKRAESILKGAHAFVTG